MANRTPMFAASRLARLLQTPAVNIVEPTVIETAQATVFDSPKTEICAAMGAVNAQEPYASLIVAKQYQVFT